MRYYHYIIAFILACGASATYWLMEREPTTVAAAGPIKASALEDEVMKASVPVTAVKEAPVAPEAENAPSEVPEDVNDRLKALGLTEEEIAERKRLQQLREAADQRFSTTVATDNLSAEKVPSSVRRLFKTMTLEPVYDIQGQAGYIDGMRIAAISDANPLAMAGFRAGDRLTSFNGLPLKDPAEIAYLFSSLGEEFEVCAQRGEDRRCRLVSLADDGQVTGHRDTDLHRVADHD